MNRDPLPVTERHHAAVRLDQLSSTEILAEFEREDLRVCAALEALRAPIEALAQAMQEALRAGGRIFYVGAGTSARIGALDAAEWPPTFGVDASRLQAIVAGGDGALLRAVEGAEDRGDEAVAALESVVLSTADLVIGISASGAAAFVSAALAYAREIGCRRAFLTANADSAPQDAALVLVAFDTGPELLTGSTRLKAATATHRILQRASNLCAVASGWIHDGWMVEMRPTNKKLQARAVRTVAALGHVDEARAGELLDACDSDIKVAVVCARSGESPANARQRLAQVERHLRQLPEFATESDLS